MSEESRSGSEDPQAPPTAESPRARRGPPPNPLYHPLFLPILLVVYCLWFGWDGFFSGPDYEHRTFNQVMFGITAVLCLWVVPRGLREWRAGRSPAARPQDDGNAS